MSLIRMQSGIIGRTAGLGPTPAWAGAGAVAKGNAQNLTPGFPSDIMAGELLMLHIESTTLDDLSSSPAGFIEQFDDQRNSGSGNEIRQWIFYKYAVGDESGTLTVEFSSTGNKMAYISRITNPHPSAPFEGAALVQGTDDPITGPTLTPAGANRLGLAFIAAGDDQTAANVFSGATGGSWTNLYVNSEPAGLDSALFLCSADLSSGTVITGGSFSPNMVGTADWIVRGVMIKPTGV